MNEVVQSTFIPGDSWLYYKLYTGPRTSDVLLSKTIGPVANELLKDGLIDRWYFIRYSDPDYHLRVRFHFNKSNHIIAIMARLKALFEEYVREHRIWKIQIDTYQRELERYGMATMELSEELFFHNSRMIVDFLGLIGDAIGEEERWLFGLKAIDDLLCSFEYTEKAKLTLLESLKTAFGREFGMSRMLKKQLDEKYRKSRNKVDDFLIFDQKKCPAHFESMHRILLEKKDQTNNIARNVLSLINTNIEEKEMRLHNLMGSYIHMQMNRLFKSNNRLHEMVSYDFLYRHYKSRLARQEKN